MIRHDDYIIFANEVLYCKVGGLNSYNKHTLHIHVLQEHFTLAFDTKKKLNTFLNKLNKLKTKL